MKSSMVFFRDEPSHSSRRSGGAEPRRMNMTKMAMLASATVAVNSHLIFALADEVPNFDVRAVCRSESVADPNAGTTARCIADEQNARATLITRWDQFAPQNRTNCVQEQALGGTAQSYVELLTCLQIAKEVKDLPKE